MRSLPLLHAVLLASSLAAQGFDARDVVRTRQGSEIRGRVSRAFEPDEIVVMQGSKRVRVARQDVAAIETVNDRLREFFRRLDAGGNNPKYRWMLAEWAQSQGLANMALALALERAIDDDTHVAAHTMLGHRQTPRGWLWPLGDRFVDQRRWLEHHADMGHPLAVVGEHYAVETDGDAKSAVYALLDLERLYLHWLDTFGTPLQLREALIPMRMRIWRSREQMPGLSSSHKRPYMYAICVRADHGTTCMTSPTTHEVDGLIMLGTQMAIGGTLIGQEADGEPMADLVQSPWAVIGIAQWMQTSFHGAPGRMKPGPPQLLRDVVARLQQDRPRLKRLLSLRYEQFYDATSSTQDRWDASWALSHFLLDATQKPDLRERFHRYLLQTMRVGQGTSSSAFDKALEMRIEAVQKAAYAWLDRL